MTFKTLTMPTQARHCPMPELFEWLYRWRLTFIRPLELHLHQFNLHLLIGRCYVPADLIKVF